MIAIINMKRNNSKGETLYHVKINQQLITTFYHERTDGLEVCLKKASEAVNKQKTLELIKLMKTFDA